MIRIPVELRRRIAVFFGLVVVSSALYVAFHGPYQERVLFYPDSVGGGLSGEVRHMRKVWGLENAVRVLVEDHLVGPAEIHHRRAFPKNTRVRSLLVRNATVYVDLSPETIFGDTETRASLEEGIAALKTTIRFNFRQIRGIFVFVGGLEPGQPAYVEGK